MVFQQWDQNRLMHLSSTELDCYPLKSFTTRRNVAREISHCPTTFFTVLYLSRLFFILLFLLVFGVRVVFTGWSSIYIGVEKKHHITGRVTGRFSLFCYFIYYLDWCWLLPIWQTTFALLRSNFGVFFICMHFCVPDVTIPHERMMKQRLAFIKPQYIFLQKYGRFLSHSLHSHSHYYFYTCYFAMRIVTFFFCLLASRSAVNTCLRPLPQIAPFPIPDSIEMLIVQYS